jgi:hypothetical protein
MTSTGTIKNLTFVDNKGAVVIRDGKKTRTLTADPQLILHWIRSSFGAKATRKDVLGKKIVYRSRYKSLEDLSVAHP